jgi:hypothetical protein
MPPIKRRLANARGSIARMTENPRDCARIDNLEILLLPPRN